MSNLERLLSVMIMMSATMTTRFLPFLFFKKELSQKTKTIAALLPYATMGLLVVYALKDSFKSENYFGVIEVIGLMMIAITYKKTDHILMSIGSGLLLYLLIVKDF